MAVQICMKYVKPVGRMHFPSSALQLMKTKDSMGNNKGKGKSQRFQGLLFNLRASLFGISFLLFFNSATTSEGFISHSGLATAPTGGEAPLTIR